MGVTIQMPAVPGLSSVLSLKQISLDSQTMSAPNAYMAKSFPEITKRKMHSVYLDPEKHELFMQLSQKTRIAQAVLLREAVDDLLKKYQLSEKAAKSG
ncbi:MAG: Ribbon-helix-helix domain [Gammaproteobacteria bacterium]|nr:Ribbon-helix-helix domain [Gammaproteobacteria bacterium]